MILWLSRTSNRSRLQSSTNRCEIQPNRHTISLSRVRIPMHAEHNIVLPILSVCLSVSPCRDCLKMNKNIVNFFLILWLRTQTPLQNSKGTLSRGVKYKGVGKFCKYCHLSRKWYETGNYGTNTNRKS